MPLTRRLDPWPEQVKEVREDVVRVEDVVLRVVVVVDHAASPASPI